MKEGRGAGRLEPILKAARDRVESLRPRRQEIERAAAAAAVPRAFRVPTGGTTVGVIAEIKRRSPSEGLIRRDLDPVALGRAYSGGGAVAISVLTEEPNFGGSLDDLVRVAGAGLLPVLRKDFVLDEIQLLEARAAGASAVLLIVRALTDARLLALAREARSLGLATLVEAHTADEVERALAVEASLVGINARDLDTFTVDLRTAEELLPLIPSRVPAVAESGIGTREDVIRMGRAGADAVLVGTSVARSPDAERAVHGLTGVPRQERRGSSRPS